MSKIKKIFNFYFIALMTIIAFIVLTINPAFTSSSASLIVSVFAQTPSIHLDYKSLEVSNTGVIKGKIIQEISNTNDAIGLTQQQVKIKAIAAGQTLVHCLNTEENKNIVKSSNPFLATAQGSFTISKPSTVFNLQLQPNIGNVNCNQDSIVRGPATVFSNIEVSISQ